MRLYELVVILKSSLAEAQRKKLIDTIQSWFGEMKVSKVEQWGQKVFAYPIKHEESGYYVRLFLEGENIVADLGKRLIQNEDIVRHLLVRTK